MARFDIRADSTGQLFVEVQTNVLSGISTRVVIPLLAPEMEVAPTRRLNPRVEINGRSMVLATQLLTSVRNSALGPVQGSLLSRSDDIASALDAVFYGF